MCEIAIGVGADELAPEMFIGMDFGLDPGGGDRRFRRLGKKKRRPIGLGHRLKFDPKVDGIQT